MYRIIFIYRHLVFEIFCKLSNEFFQKLFLVVKLNSNMAIKSTWHSFKIIEGITECQTNSNNTWNCLQTVVSQVRHLHQILTIIRMNTSVNIAAYYNAIFTTVVLFHYIFTRKTKNVRQAANYIGNSEDNYRIYEYLDQILLGYIITSIYGYWTTDL